MGAQGRNAAGDREDSGGIFDVQNQTFNSADLKFRGWNPSFKRRWLTAVTVEQGSARDIETAVIKKMIELIRSRVYQEVQDYNLRQRAAGGGGVGTTFRGLVTPGDAERALNGAMKLRKPREIDWKDQFEKAQDAFERNGFFVLVDDKQAESLDERVTLRADTSVIFIRSVKLPPRSTGASARRSRCTCARRRRIRASAS